MIVGFYWTVHHICPFCSISTQDCGSLQILVSNRWLYAHYASITNLHQLCLYISMKSSVIQFHWAEKGPYFWNQVPIGTFLSLFEQIQSSSLLCCYPYLISWLRFWVPIWSLHRNLCPYWVPNSELAGSFEFSAQCNAIIFSQCYVFWSPLFCKLWGLTNREV